MIKISAEEFEDGGFGFSVVADGLDMLLNSELYWTPGLCRVAAQSLVESCEDINLYDMREDWRDCFRKTRPMFLFTVCDKWGRMLGHSDYFVSEKARAEGINFLRMNIRYATFDKKSWKWIGA